MEDQSSRIKRASLLVTVVKGFSVLVYLGLTACLLVAVYNGPYKRYLRNDTRIVEDYVPFSGKLS